MIGLSDGASIATIAALVIVVLGGLAYAFGVIRPWRIAEAEYQTLRHEETKKPITNVRVVIKSKTRNDQNVEVLTLVQFEHFWKRSKWKWADGADNKPLEGDAVNVKGKERKTIQRQIDAPNLPYTPTAVLIQGPRRRPLVKKLRPA